MRNAMLTLSVGAILGAAGSGRPRGSVAFAQRPDTTDHRDAGAKSVEPEANVLEAAGAVESLSWSPNGKILAVQTKPNRDATSRSRSRRVELWDPIAGKLQSVLFETTEPTFSARFSPKGDAVACAVWTRPNPLLQLLGSADAGFASKVRIWDAATGTQTKTLDLAPEHGLSRAFSSDLLTCVYSPGGALVAAAGKLTSAQGIVGQHIGGELCVWDAKTGELKWHNRTTHTDIVYALAFSPDGNTLASGGIDKLIRLWNPMTGELKRTLVGAAWEGVLSLAGAVLASGGRGREEGGLIRIWNHETGALRRTLKAFPRGNPVRIVFSPRSSILYAVGNTDGSPSPAWSLRQFRVSTGASKNLVRERPGYARAISISPDGKRIAVGAADGAVILYDTKMQQLENMAPAESDQ